PENGAGRTSPLFTNGPRRGPFVNSGLVLGPVRAAEHRLGDLAVALRVVGGLGLDRHALDVVEAVLRLDDLRALARVERAERRERGGLVGAERVVDRDGAERTLLLAGLGRRVTAHELLPLLE